MYEGMRKTFDIVYKDVVADGCGYIDWKNSPYKNCEGWYDASKVAEIFEIMGYYVYADMYLKGTGGKEGTIACLRIYNSEQNERYGFVRWIGAVKNIC